MRTHLHHPSYCTLGSKPRVQWQETSFLIQNRHWGMDRASARAPESTKVNNPNSWLLLSVYSHSLGGSYGYPPGHLCPSRFQRGKGLRVPLQSNTRDKSHQGLMGIWTQLILQEPPRDGTQDLVTSTGTQCIYQKPYIVMSFAKAINI